MTFILKDRVKDTSTTEGTGDFTVSGTAPTGFQTFDDVMSSSDTTFYAIVNAVAGEWEVGVGTYSGSNVLARTAVLDSSNSGSAVNFSAGTKDVFMDLPATQILPASIYDPNNKAADAFSMDNMVEGDDAKILTAAERTKLSNTSGTNTGDQSSVTGNAGTATKLATARNIDGQSFDGSADVTVIAPGTHAATSKTTPVDADEIPLVDSAASNVLKKLTWTNLKATLKTYFDTLYQAFGSEAIVTKTASATLALTDAGKLIRMNVASANDLTIPANSSVAFPVETRIDVAQSGAGTTTVKGDTGVTVNGVSAGSGDISQQYGAVCLIKTGTDTWEVYGAIGDVA